MTELVLRPAAQADIDHIEKSYSDLFDLQERTVNHTNWQRGVYPTRAVAEKALERGQLYVTEDEKGFAAGVILNSFQPEAYWEMPWKYPVLMTDASWQRPVQFFAAAKTVSSCFRVSLWLIPILYILTIRWK